MRKKLLALMSLVAMLVAGTGLKAQEVTIQLMPGWNWIAYPFPETVSIETLLGTFEPMECDMIGAFAGSSEYLTGIGWLGEVDSLRPGLGYMYYSSRTEAVNLVLHAPSSQVSVATATPSGITTTSAVVGGTVTVPEGGHVFLRGVCWGTESNPDIDGSHTSEEPGVGSFSSTLEDMDPNTIYYLRAYAVTDYGLAYGEEMSFITLPLPTFTISVLANPIEGGIITGGGIYEQGQICTLTANAYPGCTFNNWTENGLMVSTDDNYTFIVQGDRTLVANFNYNSISGHGYVDLGLPSGLLWATCNVGADNPEDLGDYFAWGETQPKNIYNWSTYQYCMGSYNTLTKYCNNSSYGYNGFTDNLTTLLPGDDAATANWGEDWRMPTKDEWQELLDHTSHTWTNCNGVNGWLFTASNGNTLFLAAAGSRYDGNLFDADFGDYWSSSLTIDAQAGNYISKCSWLLLCYPNNINNDLHMGYTGMRESGCSVRAVCSSAPNSVPMGAINGKFTINNTGDQIYFSQGNLQYQASTNTWKFAEHQYDYVGSANSNISQTYSGWIDLFGWGTSGYNHGANCYQPWSTSSSYSDYYAYGNATYNLFNLYDQTSQADWGYNPISNGGNQANRWRTLTQSEWAYVFNTRTTSSGIRYAKANVNNVNGVILLPDDWSTSYYTLSNTNSSGASFSSNTISATQWNIMEQHGAVFLPAAGRRSGTSVSSVGSYGLYWSASHYDSYCAYDVDFYGSYLSPQDHSYYRCNGLSVRLARVAE